MASRKLKRPSSARRYIKQEAFSPFVSGSRLRQVQAVLSPAEPSLDAILCILGAVIHKKVTLRGIDSRYNEGCRELINYLLFGFFDVRRNELEKSGFADEVLDDMMFVIRCDCVHVYCNPVNYHYLLPYIGSWRNLRIHCMKDEQYDDNEEEAEEFKIHSFISMVKGCSNIGIPFYRAGESGPPFDKMLIEKWPIVQAFALEDFGGGGFFTMRHDVSDVSSYLSKVYSTMDPVAVETLACDYLPLFERQWNTLLSVVDVESRNNGMLNLTETKVCEPLQSFYNHGRVGDHHEAGRKPFVLFGTHTAKESMSGEEVSSVTSLGTSGVLGTRAKHMVCNAVSARSPIACTRTYFFGLNHKPFSVSGNGPSAPPSSKDQNLLNQTYAIIVDVVMEVLPIYASTLSCKQARSKAYRLVQDRCALLGLDVDSSNMFFTIEILNNHGQASTVLEGKSSPYVKLASLCVYDIPSSEHPGHKIGSVCFADSFLESTVRILDNGKESLDGQYTILTAHIPRYTSWMISQQELESSEKVEQFLKSPKTETFGKALVHGATVDVWSCSNMAVMQEATLHVFEEAVLLSDSRFGCFCLPKNMLTNIQFYDGDSTSSVALLTLTYSPMASNTVPVQLYSDDFRLIIGLAPKTKAYKEFFSDVFHLWHHQESTPMQIITQLPLYLKKCHVQLQNKYQVFSRHDTSVSPLRKAEVYLPDLQGFLDHLAVSSVCSEPIPKADLPVLLKQTYDTGTFDSYDELVVTIIGGVVGSYREELAQTLTNLNKEQQRWMVIKHPTETVQLFDPVGLQNTLTAAVHALKKKSARPGGGGRKKMRALVVTPGFTDIIHVVACITNHPDIETSRHLKIGSVTVCVDPLNVFMHHRMTLPKLLDQCALGFVNNVLFTSSTNLKNEALLEAQTLIRAVNPDVAFLLAERGQMTRSPDIELILSEDAFTENNMTRSRHLSQPCWKTMQFSVRDCYPAIGEVSIQFPQPLERSKFVAKLRSLHSSLKSHPYVGNVYAVRGSVTFSDSPTKKMEVYFVTLSNSLQISATDFQPKPPSVVENGQSPSDHNVVVFTGCSLEELKLRDWLRACGKQKPEKKPLRTPSSLSTVELKNIETKHHLDPLPEGWFYNGNQYVSMMGDRQTKHPSLADHIAAYVDEMNKLIIENNAKIDQMHCPDLFQE